MGKQRNIRTHHQQFRQRRIFAEPLIEEDNGNSQLQPSGRKYQDFSQENSPNYNKLNPVPKFQMKQETEQIWKVKELIPKLQNQTRQTVMFNT